MTRAVLRLPSSIRACLFDLDGVLTDTATLHAKAWQQMFDDFLRERATHARTRFLPFDAVRDYDEYIDGRNRFDGVRSFLAARGVELPEGTHGDPADSETIGGLGNRKNELLLALIHSRGVQTFDGSIRFLHAAVALGLRRAVVSASANCAEVLEAAGIAACFEVRVDGIVAEREHLQGKPAPDMFLTAATRLGVEPGEGAVFEDSLAGVAAGRSGRFGLVVGVDRVGQAASLLAHGADIVVADLDELIEDD